MNDWTQRFAELAERKTRESLSAPILPYTTEFDRARWPRRPLGNPWSHRLFDGHFWISPPLSTDLPTASLVFVQSRDRNTGTPNPSSLGGGATDTHLIYEGLSRVAADAVMAGAGTVRGGPLVMSVWHPEMIRLRADLGLPRHPIQIVVSLRGMDLEEGLLFNVPEISVVVITGPGWDQAQREALRHRPWIQEIAIAHAGELTAAFRRLRARGIHRISVIGGRRLAAALIDARLVQDLYLTTSPAPGGEPNTPLYPRPLAADVLVRKHGTGAEAGVVFEHLELPR